MTYLLGWRDLAGFAADCCRALYRWARHREPLQFP